MEPVRMMFISYTVYVVCSEQTKWNDQKRSTLTIFWPKMVKSPKCYRYLESAHQAGSNDV